jgi:hypothetical protein
MISWKDIEQQIKKNLPQMNIKNVEIRNINPNFEQTTDLKTFFEDYYPEMEMDIMRAQIQKEQIELSQKPEQEVVIRRTENKPKLDFTPHQIMELPSQLVNILPNSDKLCIYGVPRADSFLMATMSIVKKDFIFYDNKKQKDDYIKDRKMQLAMCLKDYFKENNYRLLGSRKADMENELINEHELSDFNRWYIADYYKVNILVLNLVNKTFQYTSSWNVDHPVVLMLQENDIYLPVLNTQGENIFPLDIIKVITKYYEEEKNPLVVSYDKKMKQKAKKEIQKSEKFKDLSKLVDGVAVESESESDKESDNDTESEPEISDTESDIELKVNYNVDEDEDNDDADDDADDDEEIKANGKILHKKPMKGVYTKLQVNKMTLTELKSVAKNMNISLSKDSKSKKKADLLAEIVEKLD